MNLTPKEEAVLNLIGEDLAYENYFFKKVSDIKWFYPLKNKGFFAPSKAPTPKPADQEGYFIIPEWNVLPYLEKVSQQVSILGNEKYIDDLLAIIKEVSNYRDSNGQHIDNYRTWYYFVKILCNIPNEKIPLDIIELIPIWLDSRFDTMLQGAEIATKLLPKFLTDNPEDWKKAEKLIEIITDIKWVSIPENLRNLRERDVEARTLIEPYWLKKGLDKSFDKIGKVCSIRVIEGLAKKLLVIFSKQYSHGYDIEVEGKKYEITHMLLEDGNHQISVHSLKYPEDWDGFSRSKIEKTLVTNFIVSDFENRDGFVTKVKDSLRQKNIFPSLNTELDESISSIYTLHDYTYIGYNSLYVSPEHMNIDDTDKIIIYIIKEILAVKAHHDKNETSKILDKFISNDYPYPFFKRLVLFIAGREWDKYKEHFFKIIELKEMKCFEDSDFAMELSILLQNNFSKFSDSEKKIIKKIIEAGPQQLPDENSDKYAAYWKQKWLSIMKDDPIFAPLYEEQKSITGIEKEKFSFGTEFKTSWGFGSSPLSAEQILNLSNTELAIRLKEFRSEKKWEGMTVAAFSESLKAAVITNPEKFTESLNSFEDSGFIYIYKILDGLRDCWKEKKAIEWGKIFDFVSAYIKKEGFWRDEYIIEPGTWLGGADHQWVTGIVAELIQDGTRDDSWAFSEKYFEKAEKIIFLILDNLKAEEDKEITDYVTYILNTPFGKALTALIFLALRIARINDKKGIISDIKWKPEFKDKYEEILSNKTIEGFTNLGRYMPNFYYLDKEWIKEKIKSLESEKGSKYWEAFMDGYFLMGRFYGDLYKLMRPHYQHALFYGFTEKRNQERLIEHICIGYLRDHEKLADPESLFQKTVDLWNPEQIRQIIGFFWMQKGYLTESSEENEKIKGKIIEFWKHLYDKYVGKDEASLTKEDKQILSSTSGLTVFLPKIDATSYEWLMLSASHINEDYNSSFFIEYLDELKDEGNKSETAKYIGDIYLKMLEKITPDFDQKHIRSIVEFLYDAGASDIANKICNIYGSRGYEFLRDIYEKNNR